MAIPKTLSARSWTFTFLSALMGGLASAATDAFWYPEALFSTSETSRKCWTKDCSSASALDGIYLIGWSPKGVLAWVVTENYGADFSERIETKLVAQDLNSDKIVKELELKNVPDAAEPNWFRKALNANRAAFIASIKDLGLVRAKETRPKPFPLLGAGNQAYAARLVRKLDPSRADNIDEAERTTTTVFLDLGDRQTKRVCAQKTGAVRIAGYLSSPVEERLVIVLVVSDYILEGTTRDYVVFCGADLRESTFEQK